MQGPRKAQPQGPHYRVPCPIAPAKGSLLAVPETLEGEGEGLGDGQQLTLGFGEGKPGTATRDQLPQQQLALPAQGPRFPHHRPDGEF